MDTENSALTQYSQNITSLQSRSDLVASSLQQLQSLTDQATEIATEADGTATPTQLQAYASQVSGLIQQAVSIANTQDGDQYIFGGTKSSEAPYTTTTDASGNITAVNYQGNTSVMQSDIGPGTKMSVDIPGSNTTGSGARGLFTDSRYGADLFSHLISLQSDLESGDTTAIQSTDEPALVKDENNVIYQVSANGVGQSQLTAAASNNTTQQDAVQQSISSLTGADITQTIVNLTENQTTYQAALQGSSILLNLQQSLLEYL